MSTIRLPITLALATLLAAPAARAEVWFVAGSASGANSGANWTDAFVDLQSALGQASAGDEVWVAAGVYSPAPAGGDRNATFRLRDGVALYGGFAGVEAARDERDWSANRCVLSGDLNGDDAPGFVNRADNVYQVVVALNASDATILDGFTIAGGHADGVGVGADPASKEQGSGLNVYFSSPQVANCLFRDNWSLNHGAANDHGDFSTFTNCTFRGNHSAAFGAGLYIHHHSQTTVVACTFEDNTAISDGAGAYSRSMHGAMFASCTFRDNVAEKGAGMYNAPDSATHFVECAFIGNTAHSGAGSYSEFAAPRFEACIFTANEADFDGDRSENSGGGGLWLAGGSPEVHGSTFFGNFANQGAGIYVGDAATPTIAHCSFVANTANEAGGIYNLQSSSLVHDCRFENNTVRGGTFPVGGGFSSYFASPRVVNCTFQNNRAALGGGGMYMEGESPFVANCLFTQNIATADNDCCGTQGWGGGVLFSYFTTGTLANCVITNNRGRYGGGVFALGLSEARVVNCTIASNEATEDGGGAFGFNLHLAELRNSAIWGNTPNAVAGAPFAATYNCIEGGYGDATNVSGDPRFHRLPGAGDDGQWATADDDLGDLALRAHSSCIDAARNDDYPVDVVTDFAGQARFVDDVGTPDSGAGDSPLVDIGAHEFQGRTYAFGDLNCDGAINNFDIEPFVLALVDPAAYATRYPACDSSNADANDDGEVNDFDIDPFVTLITAG
ncbi:MAG: right-handed parallel beta-helix repeat-containing protein [Phycisphaerae bacterium]